MLLNNSGVYTNFQIAPLHNQETIGQNKKFETDCLKYVKTGYITSWAGWEQFDKLLTISEEFICIEKAGQNKLYCTSLEGNLSIH